MNHQLPEGGKTLVYSTVGDHEIKLDYYLPSASGALPAVIYYHGGGMTAGSRRGGGLPHWLYAHCQEKGYIFISADYRLCHPTTALDQIEDAKNLFQFITSSHFNNILPESVTLDPSRIAVSGFSAGAYSARAACIYANPKPAALISVYGLGGNVLLDHWTRARPPTSIAKFVDLDAVPELLADKTVVSDDVSVGPLSRRFALTVHWELSGTMLDGIFGRGGLGAALDKVDYEKRAEAFPSDLKSGLLQSFVDDSYPPSIFVHGTADEVVLPQESIDQHEQLKGLGIKSELLLVEDGPHGLGAFSNDPTSAISRHSNEAYSKALNFIDDVFSGLQKSAL